MRGFIEGFDSLSPLSGVRARSATSLAAINRWIYGIGRTDPELEGMATTFSALILVGRQAHVVHVGDTRLYRLRENQLTRLTDDHVPAGKGRANILTRAVGAADELRIDYAAEAVRVHDRYLLCSDGVHGAVSDARIGGELSHRTSPDDTASRLVEMALAARLGDNATALVLDVLDLPPPAALDLELEIAGRPIMEPPRSGAVVDDFELGPMLADGQYSRVFRAIDRRAAASGHRAVVIKFPKRVAGADTVLRQAFLREAWIAARVRSQHLGEVIDLPPERRTVLYTVMPCYEGETLEQRLRRPPRLSLAAGLDIAIRLAKAVAALHRAGIIHRDIKPENVILERAGGVRLVDLGVARLPNIEEFPAADIPGTPSYMAPELFLGAMGDERSDLFALGVTIWRAFAGSYPYGEIEPFSHPRFGRPTSLLTRRPDLPAWLDHALARAIAVAPDDRFADVLEFVFALEQGSVSTAAAAPRWRPLHLRDPLAFWRTVAGLLAFALLAKCALG